MDMPALTGLGNLAQPAKFPHAHSHLRKYDRTDHLLKRAVILTY